MEYVREKVPPDVSIHLSLQDDSGFVQALTPLRRTRAQRMGSWVFSIDNAVEATEGKVILSACRKPGGWAFYLGVALFVVGSVGWTWNSRLRRV